MEAQVLGEGVADDNSFVGQAEARLQCSVEDVSWEQETR